MRGVSLSSWLKFLTESPVAHRITNETYRWVSDARFHPSGSSVIATKWYTSSRSLGAGEGWQYEVPLLEDLRHDQKSISVGDGFRVLGRSLPLGWTVDDYESQQIGPEQFIWLSEDAIIYAKNVRDASAFEYSKGRCSIGRVYHPYKTDFFPLRFRCPPGDIFHFSKKSDFRHYSNTSWRISRRCQSTGTLARSPNSSFRASS